VTPYNESPRGRFRAHRFNARRRGIEFSLSFAQWLSVWKRSGRWKQRGRGRGKFCLARINDRGAFEAGNICIISFEENGAGHEYSAEERARMSRARRNRPRNLRGQYVTVRARDLETLGTLPNVKGQGKDTLGRKRSTGRPTARWMEARA
jgi:hypothetical protein